MKIDINAHVITKKFLDTFSQRVGNLNLVAIHPDHPVNMDICNIDMRIEIIDKFDGLVQILTPTGHTLEKFAKPDDAAYLAKVYNDEMANLVLKYPDKFIAAVACLPMNNIDAALREIDRAINELKFKGVLINTPLNGQPLDLPDFMPIYESMSNYDLPIWIHPTRHFSEPDYVNEDESRYGLFHAFRWPYETTIAMGRLVGSGILAKYPNLKFITHHAGGMIPFFASRIGMVTSAFNQMRTDGELPIEGKSTREYFQMFYNDTALDGNEPALMCAHAFFGTEHLLFGTDMPYGAGLGEQFIRRTIDAVEEMNIADSDKEKIFEVNAKVLLHLDA